MQTNRTKAFQLSLNKYVNSVVLNDKLQNWKCWCMTLPTSAVGLQNVFTLKRKKYNAVWCIQQNPAGKLQHSGDITMAHENTKGLSRVSFGFVLSGSLEKHWCNVADCKEEDLARRHILPFLSQVDVISWRFHEMSVTCFGQNTREIVEVFAFPPRVESPSL